MFKKNIIKRGFLEIVVQIWKTDCVLSSERLECKKAHCVNFLLYAYATNAWLNLILHLYTVGFLEFSCKFKGESFSQYIQGFYYSTYLGTFMVIRGMEI